jgi:hypothetical protein
MSNTWDNEEPLSVRTRLALKLLMLMFKITAPYQFGNQFKEDIEKIIEELDKPPKVKP